MYSLRRAGVALVFIALSTSIPAASTGPVAVEEAIRLFLDASPQARRAPLAAQSVDAGLRVEAPIANPEIAYQIEDAAGIRDEFLTFQQRLPVTGRRGVLGDRAQAASMAAGLAAAGELQSESYDLMQSIYEVLYRERVLRRFDQGVQRLARTVKSLEQREREGHGAGYDFLRADQELAELRLAALGAEAALAAARARFGSYYDPDLKMDSVHLEGDLVPRSAVPGVEQAVEQALAQRLDLKSRSAERVSLELELRGARRRRFPEPTLTAGWKRTGALGFSDTGYIAALSVPLPIFDRGRYGTARATAEGERADLETEILTRRIRGEVQAALAREQAARTATRAYGENVEERALELHRIARLKYDEGESGILELLDAHRTSLNIELRALAARYESRSAEIARGRVVGDEVNP